MYSFGERFFIKNRQAPQLSFQWSLIYLWLLKKENTLLFMWVKKKLLHYSYFDF